MRFLLTVPVKQSRKHCPGSTGHITFNLARNLLNKKPRSPINSSTASAKADAGIPRSHPRIWTPVFQLIIGLLQSILNARIRAFNRKGTFPILLKLFILFTSIYPRKEPLALHPKTV